MPSAGDSYTATLDVVHLKWGTLSRTGSRNRSELEVYIPIPILEAKRLNIRQGTIYNAYSSDGYYEHPLRASGSQGDDYEFGKNFESQDNLKALGKWLKEHCYAQPGDQVEIRWQSDDEIVLTYRQHI